MRALWALRGALEALALYAYGLLGPRLLMRYLAWRYRRPDPWRYQTSPYEQRKYALTLALLPRQPSCSPPPYRRVLEVGCSEGVFTERLAQEGWAREVIGIDVAQAALERARARCAPFSQVRFCQLDISQEAPPGPFDLIFCAEVLYYLGPPRRLQAVCDRLVARLQPGGLLVLVSPWPGARFLHRPFKRHPDLALVREHLERDPRRPYAITLLRKSQQGASRQA